MALMSPSQADALTVRLGYEPRDRGLFVLALTHRSADGANNERLEFLGDSVLNLLLSERLYREFPLASEGDLSRLRARLVSEEPLAEVAQGMQLGELLLLGSGELKTGGFRRQSILADAFEALLAAIYLDGGIEPVKEFLLPRITAEINGIIKAGNDRDYKTSLQQVVQKEHGDILEYVTVGERGPAHMKVFTVEARLNGNVIGTGNGRSKRAAEQNAAREALALFGL